MATPPVPTSLSTSFAHQRVNRTPERRWSPGPGQSERSNREEIQERMTLADLERVSQLRNKLLERRTVYSYCANYYGKRYYVLIVPSIMITTAISVLAVIWPYDGEAEVAGRVLISLLGAAATVTTATLALCRYQSKMDVFYNSSEQVDGMVSALSFLVKYRMGDKVSRTELQQVIAGIEDKLGEVRSNAPPIPNFLWVAGCLEEDKMLELRRTRTKQVTGFEGLSSRKKGWADGSQIQPPQGSGFLLPGSPDSPKEIGDSTK
mmetsp:Transcript_40324/g.114462  ORF Transcript_40324/g.114462 Transcript_40324/m.114462 type:complete len:263 (-) Transcript_40324:213-1001(-)